MNDRFQNFYSGLAFLCDFAPIINFDNVPRSNPGGVPQHSGTSFCYIRLNSDLIWPHIARNPNFIPKMKQLGWQSEQEDTIWIFQ